jgi:ubiquinol-cytochrome c reductase cytochrome b subunit/menaquinol-cytochrome c reductase cytochrome b/c subunit
VNQREKEEYLREYSILKAQGKPFFPYAVAKDTLMGCIVIAVIITLSLVLGAQIGPKANAATTTYVPRPDWYFFFLFELLRRIHPPDFLGLSTIGVPTIAMVLLFLLPFYDRGAERHPLRRPIATLAGISVICAMGYLTWLGASAGSPLESTIKPSAQVISEGKAAVAEFYFGRTIVAQSGCEACHNLGSNGNPGPGPSLTHIGARIPKLGLARTLVNPTQPMPSYGTGPFKLPPKQFEAVITFLSDLK